MNFLKSLVQKFTGRPVDWDELEGMLIRADLGVPMTLRIIEALQDRAQRTTITSNDIVEVARDEIARILPMAPLPNGMITLKNRALGPVVQLFMDCARRFAQPLAQHRGRRSTK